LATMLMALRSASVKAPPLRLSVTLSTAITCCGVCSAMFGPSSGDALRSSGTEMNERCLRFSPRRFMAAS